MLRPRIIPCLLIKNNGLVKTVGFTNPKYVGDPINAVRIFNEKEADELIVLDIDATAQGRAPNFGMIEHLAAECRMPLCYGGGVRTTAHAKAIIQLGVEKVAMSAAALENPAFISDIANAVGRQSVVVALDVKKNTKSNLYEVFTHNGTRLVEKPLLEIVVAMEACGAGEIVLNAIDRDGEMKGYDTDLIAAVRRAIRLPLTVLGGAGSINDMKDIIARHGIIGAAAGSLFVFKGPYRAVLINYPSPSEKASFWPTRHPVDQTG